MEDRRDATGRLLPDAARLRPCGRFLRRLRLDELPELWNVLRGDMALVGPRPLLPQDVAAMGADGERRGGVRPGLTGWAQVNGNTRLDTRDKLVLDLWYIEHRSLRLDLRIFLRTLATLIAGEQINDFELGRAHARALDWRG
jgi:lipopolysaccharide/colanic/teichoic acid biosynthesis glycosyltransferase